ncbi:hypothetical protein R1flu_016427 [Riccia fluitans]|uniref:Uncharacterized protein n=1 Tax=Riccia fluitans TaxID=41844 RepID=A0ABD1YLT6_9MARC
MDVDALLPSLMMKDHLNRLRDALDESQRERKPMKNQELKEAQGLTAKLQKKNLALTEDLQPRKFQELWQQIASSSALPGSVPSGGRSASLRQ